MLEKIEVDVQERGRMRVVLEHTTGPHKGLMQIIGRADEFDNGVPPSITDVFTILPNSRRGQASLVRAFPRYFLYREIDVTPQLKAFDPRQR